MYMIPLDSHMQRIRISLLMLIEHINASFSQKLHDVAVPEIRSEPETINAGHWVLHVDVKRRVLEDSRNHF